MVLEKVKRYFRGKEKYNCAQAIIIAFYEKCGIDKKIIEEKIKEYLPMGHGKAKGGLCGAVFAGIF